MIALSPASGVPLYRQIVAQIKQMVGSGRLTTDQRLESVRQLAARLGVSPLTAAKAYDRLVAEGVLQSRPGKGYFVAGGVSRLSHNARRQALARVLDQAVAEAFQLDVTEDEALALLRERFAEADKSSPATPGKTSPAFSGQVPRDDSARASRAG